MITDYDLPLLDDIWVLIALGDPRVYNTLVRTNMRLNAILSSRDERIRDKFTSDEFVSLNNNTDELTLPVPAICGKINDSGQTKHILRYNRSHYFTFAASYGRLVRNPAGPSFTYYGDIYSGMLLVYAHNGGPDVAREPRPYIMSRQLRSSSAIFDVYSEEGIPSKIVAICNLYVARGICTPDQLANMTERYNLNDNHAIVIMLDIKANVFTASIVRDCVIDSITLDKFITEVVTDKSIVSSVPAIPDDVGDICALLAECTTNLNNIILNPRIIGSIIFRQIASVLRCE